jgi:hypothetical protein
MAKYPDWIERAARARLSIDDRQIAHSLDLARKGTPLAAEPDINRLASRLKAKANLSEAAEAGRPCSGSCYPPAPAHSHTFKTEPGRRALSR